MVIISRYNIFIVIIIIIIIIITNEAILYQYMLLPTYDVYIIPI